MSVALESEGFIETFSSWFDWSNEKAQQVILRLKTETAMPWWGTICTVTIGLRVLVFPLRIRAWRNGQLMRQCTQHCNETLAPLLRAKFALKEPPEARSEAFKSAMLATHKSLSKHVSFSPWKSLSPLPVSVPLFLSVAAALRAFDFDGEGLGFVWKNFGEAEWISAVPVTLTNFAFIEFSRRSITPKRLVPFILGHCINLGSFAILTCVPSGVNLFLLTSAALSLLESIFLHQAASSNNFWLNRWIIKDFNKKIQTFKF